MSELKLKDLYDGFRDPATIRMLAAQIGEEAKALHEPLRIMEVCGGHTHTIMKYGLPQLLPGNIDFIHGPGCPVCIMPKERIDHAIALARMEDTILVTLGDMIRVPGSQSSLAVERAAGRDIRPLYTPMDALKIAKENPDKRVVFFAIGFETTTPMTAALLHAAVTQKVDNLYFHINHVLVPPAIDAIMSDGQAKINAFIGPSHVSVITGAKIYAPLPQKYGTPVVVCGFEPVDVMQGILMAVRQQVEGRAELEIEYSRSVTMEGNVKAQQLIDMYLQPRSHFRWRGIGDIPDSALELREEFAYLDAEKVFAEVLPTEPIDDHKLCICGTILKGLAKPMECKVFGTACTPNSPLGSCMVSSEGACNAYYRYAGVLG
ncbi:hydrogenase formation protein HypD [Sulfurimonas sp. HSL-3221]|uniref:hydrogenase formation protein HypD n=1 Tax=Thiomicrolovo sulfuroxydans TaxID=2894755 RepID=UPI001E2FF869|nr:hydrogenase formation protein HypD [Sulfurimonas sp. HSL-3221]UFS62485.1 hydrogenase formation protein HypD [Sulfurimonas sp. HSL-3221]